MDQISNEAAAARRAYQRAYRKKHPDKVRQWQRNFWEKLAERESASSACVNESPAAQDTDTAI